ncbi:dihydropyrimidinase-like isoform X2 [Magnolia sinica]|uniref:dihydropyrimidinase-like isoform X2 n=1 Tax=Magnolia sinica TaxID=86752 RepID=UPI0026592D68|nr:dihydropyrimidinase-like isoform X2 [Magnolia sinica]
MAAAAELLSLSLSLREIASDRKSLLSQTLEVHRLVLITIVFLLSFSLFPIAQSQQIPEFYGGVGYVDPNCGPQGSQLKILIKGGTVVNAHHQEVADVYIEDGIIVSVGPNMKVSDDVTVLDATGKYVMPGGIDPHTHLAMEFMGTETIDDFFSGQAAALAGGTTMHIDFVIPVNGSLTAGYESYLSKAKISCMDYGFHMAITKFDEVVSKEMELMVKEKGINSFKFFLAYKGSLMISDELLLQGLEKCKSLGALAMVHAENGDGVAAGQKRMIDLGITGPEGHALSRPPVLEGEATGRAIRLASFVNTPLYIVHVMSTDAMEEIAKAKKSGQRVIGETVVSGLVLDDSWLWHPDFTTAAKYVMSPPIRKLGHDKALQAALSMGILQLVGTDHCTFNSTQKAFGIDDFRKIPNGVNGIGERMHLIWDTMVESGRISVTDYVKITSTEWVKWKSRFQEEESYGKTANSRSSLALEGT